MKNVVPFIFLISAACLTAQSKPFEINGTIKGMDNGFAEFFSGRGDTVFKISDKKVNIENGVFSFKGDLSYTSSIILKLTDNEKSFFTPWFYVDSRKQTLTLSTTILELFGEDSVLSVISSGKTETEYNEKFKRLKASAQSKFDEFRTKKIKLYRELNYIVPEVTLDSLSDLEDVLKNELKIKTIQYIKENPSSKISLQKAYNLIKGIYEPWFDSIYDVLDKNLLTSDIGKKITENLHITKSLCLGSIFPALSLMDSSSNKIILDKSLLNKYTFCDFWFHGCGWCIKQMPELNEIYAKWHSKGLEIIGITVDPKEKEQAWKNVIAKQNVKWLQLWDINSVEANKLSVNFFPTSFLLDKSGKIVAVNIKASELEKFLAARL